MNNNLIYGLRDPRNDLYKYIGKTTVGEYRALSHLKKSHNTGVNDWISSIRNLGYEPIVDILEDNIEASELNEREKYWIQIHLSSKILNINCTKYSINTIDHKHIKIAGEVLSDIPKLIKYIKSKLKITQEELAEKVGVSRATISKLETGKTKSDISVITKMIDLVI